MTSIQAAGARQHSLEPDAHVRSRGTVVALGATGIGAGIGALMGFAVPHAPLSRGVSVVIGATMFGVLGGAAGIAAKLAFQSTESDHRAGRAIMAGVAGGGAAGVVLGAALLALAGAFSKHAPPGTRGAAVRDLGMIMIGMGLLGGVTSVGGTLIEYATGRR